MIAAAGSQVLWYVSRGTGLVLLVLLTLVVVLGMAVQGGWRGPRGQRFVVEGLHRNLALVSVVLLALHVATAVTDPFARIGWLSAVVPFTSPYRTAWIALGTLAVDLIGAVLVTSLVRRHLRYGAWRAVHWLAYLAWPLAFVHSIYSSTDTKIFAVLVIDWSCAAAVAAAVASRLLLSRARDTSGRGRGGRGLPVGVRAVPVMATVPRSRSER